MSSVLIYGHLGLGDQIVYHGIVREFSQKYDQVTLLATPHTFASVAFMYRDVSNVRVISCTHLEAPEFLSSHSADFTDIKKMGFEFLDRKSGIPLDKQFYALADVEFQKKWENFNVVRDPAREQALFERVSPPEKYIFLHDDPERDFSIRRNKVPSALSTIHPRPELTENIFDYCLLIERATEIHVIDSSFMFLIDCLSYDASYQKLFVHRYARPNTPWHLPVLKKRWTIIGTSMPSIRRRCVSALRHATHSLLFSFRR